ncbi:unnamed protein product [Heterosigma akashiwo]
MFSFLQAESIEMISWMASFYSNVLDSNMALLCHPGVKNLTLMGNFSDKGLGYLAPKLSSGKDATTTSLGTHIEEEEEDEQCCDFSAPKLFSAQSWCEENKEKANGVLDDVASEELEEVVEDEDDWEALADPTAGASLAQLVRGCFSVRKQQ